MFRSRRRVGRTYQGFVKALIRWSPRLLRRIEARLREPRTLSVAGALRTIRTVLRQPERRARPTRSLMRRLGGAVKDTYKRRTSKAARNWPHKKTERPPGRPRIRDANAVEVHAAQQLRAKHQAA